MVGVDVLQRSQVSCVTVAPTERKNQREHLCVTVDNSAQGHVIFPGMCGK